MKQDEEQSPKEHLEVARNMWNCIKGGEEYIEEMCKKYKNYDKRTIRKSGVNSSQN